MNEIKSDKIKRVTAGDGGEAWLILGSEKTAMFDCGMAYCGDKMVENTKDELKGRRLDYAILTHTHYDHVGGLPYLRKEWPNLVALGAAYGQGILKRPSARRAIKNLSEIAYHKYLGEGEPNILMDGLSIDSIVKDGDEISLGKESLKVIETPGHTLCSLSFVLYPDDIIFPSETIGVLTRRNTIVSPILKSYTQAMESIEKCRRMKAKHIVSPHYGWVLEEQAVEYWDLAIRSAEENIQFVIGLWEEGANEEEQLEAYTKKYWVGTTANQQPKEAFLINARQIIKVIKEEHLKK